MDIHETIVIHTNHMDIIWKRPACDYVEIQTDIINKVLEMMDRYPNFTFFVEQAVVLYHYISIYPEKREILQKYIDEGRFEIIGGGWTLIDTNLVLGESIVRNMLLGTRYLEEELGIKVKIGCFTDVFGMCSQLPQILQQFNINYLLPGRTVGIEEGKGLKKGPFVWVGADGSEILCGLYGAGSTVGYYEPMNSDWVIQQVKDNLSRALQETPLSVCAISSEEVLPRYTIFEKLLKLSNERKDIKFNFGTIREYYEKLQKLIKKDKTELQKHYGEFNPVFTGCYTTRSKIKLANVKLQSILLSTEALIVAARTQGFKVNQEALTSPWRKVILNQFHDSICGCNSASAFRDIMQRYASAEKDIRQVHENISNGNFCAHRRNGEATIFNPLIYERGGLICLDSEKGSAFIEKEFPKQVAIGGKLYVYIPSIAPLSSILILRDPQKTTPSLKESESRSIQNGIYVINTNGKRITSIRSSLWDNRSIRGYTGQLIIREDKGGFWSTRPTGRIISCAKSIENCKIETSLLLKRIVMRGKINSVPWDKELVCEWEQEIRLWEDSEIVDFIYRINWHGKKSILSAVIPIPFYGTEAAYETPFAVWKRSSYTPRPEAPFGADKGGEWPSLRFVSVSNGLYGVSLIHYGCHGIIRDKKSLIVNLLRSPSDENYECGVIYWDRYPADGVLPDASAQEEGEHEFRLSLCMHRGDWVKGGILRLAEKAYHPLMKMNGVLVNFDLFKMLELPPNVGISCLKLAEDNSGIILRLWEGKGEETQCSIKISKDVKRIFICNMKEERKTPLEQRDGIVRINMKPYEVITVLFETLLPSSSQ